MVYRSRSAESRRRRSLSQLATVLSQLENNLCILVCNAVKCLLDVLAATVFLNVRLDKERERVCTYFRYVCVFRGNACCTISCVHVLTERVTERHRERGARSGLQSVRKLTVVVQHVCVAFGLPGGGRGRCDSR